MQTGASVKSSFYKTRLAPTPSGYLHLGNVTAFVYTVALAKSVGARIMLRIDDYDRDRIAPHFIQDVFDTLRWLDLPWEEGPADLHEFQAQFAQKHRRGLYERALQQLIEQKQVYACTCSRADIIKRRADGSYPGTCWEKNLPLHTPGAALRIITPEKINLVIQTPWATQAVHVLPASVHDFVVRKKDGDPAYQLCSVVDDVYFGLNLIVRGADLWPSTLAQAYLSTVLGADAFTNAAFVHHPVLLDGNGHKMSKSAGATSVHYLRQQGCTPAAVYSRIGSLLGIAEPVHNWQMLSERMTALQNWPGPGKPALL